MQFEAGRESRVPLASSSSSQAGQTAEEKPPFASGNAQRWRVSTAELGAGSHCTHHSKGVSGEEPELY